MSGRSAWLRRRPETFWVQVGVGLTTVGWGTYVLGTGGPVRELPVYDEAMQFVPAWAWGRIAVVIGLLQAGAALGGLRWPRLQTWPRRGTGLAVMLFWKVLGVSMFNSGEPSPMAVVACGLALMNLPVVVLPLLRPR